MINLKLNSSKCNLFSLEICYLTQTLSAKGVRTDLEKTSVIENWNLSEDVHQLRSSYLLLLLLLLLLLDHASTIDDS